MHRQELREQARRLRQQGLSLTEIANALPIKVPKSTIQGWVRDIPLTPEQQKRIWDRILGGGARGRAKARAVIKQRHEEFLVRLRQESERLLDQLLQDESSLVLLALGLYLGEGSKQKDTFCFGNSDPSLIRVWQSCLRRIFKIDESKWAAQLSLSEGMNEHNLKQFWSRVTGVPLHRFHKTSWRRGRPAKIREGYCGVCLLHYYDLRIRRFLDMLWEVLLERLSVNVGP